MKGLSAGERERYTRHLGLPGWDRETQQRLKDSVVFVAGLGGLGSPVTMYLAAAGIGCLRLCDADCVEASNLNRQLLHGGDDIDIEKALSAQEALAAVNPHVRTVPLVATIEDATVEALVGDARLIVDCLDNFDARYVLNHFAVRTGTPLVHAGVSGLSGQITFLHPPETPCLRCIVPDAPTSGVFPILGATAGVIGCLEALEAVKYCSGTGRLLKNRMVLWDGEDMKFWELDIRKEPECPACGRRDA